MIQDSVILHSLINSGIREEDQIRTSLVTYGIPEESPRFIRIMDLFIANNEAGNVKDNKIMQQIIGKSILKQRWNVVKVGTPIYVGFILLNLAWYAAKLKIQQQALGQNVPIRTIMREVSGADIGSVQSHRLRKRV